MSDRPTIPVGDDEELAGPAVVAAKQVYKGLQAEYDEMNVLQLDSIMDQLTQSQRVAVTRIENIIDKGALERDFTGVAQERQGVSVGISPRTGRSYDHIQEMENNQRGLQKAIDILKKSLESSKLDSSIRELLTSELRRAQSTFDAFTKALGGSPL